MGLYLIHLACLEPIDKNVHTPPWLPQKLYPIPDQNGQSLQPFSDQNGAITEILLKSSI